MALQITSATLANRVAIDLGFTLLADRRGPPSPRGNDTGHVLWAVPDGLLGVVDAHHDAEAGNAACYEVLHGPHAGRRLASYGGSGWFQPSLAWVEEASKLDEGSTP